MMEMLIPVTMCGGRIVLAQDSPWTVRVCRAALHYLVRLVMMVILQPAVILGARTVHAVVCSWIVRVNQAVVLFLEHLAMMAMRPQAMTNGRPIVCALDFRWTALVFRVGLRCQEPPAMIVTHRPVTTFGALAAVVPVK